jgi:hypothetical protein
MPGSRQQTARKPVPQRDNLGQLPGSRLAVGLCVKRQAASSPPLRLVETEMTCRSGVQFDALNVDRLAETFRGSPARDFLLGFKVFFVQDGERAVVPFAAVGHEEVGGAGER